MVGKQPIRSLLGIFALALVTSEWSSAVFGQGQPIPARLPPDASFFEEDGTVLGVMPNLVQVITPTAGTWWVQVVPGKTQIKITGMAEPTFLHGGIFVKFSGEIDAKGMMLSEVKEMEIFTPTGKNSSGVFSSGADEKAKPINKFEAGTYDIRGRVASYKDGQIQVVAGKKITGKVAGDAKIAINVQDISFVQKDDIVKARGYTYKQFAPDISTNRQGKAMGTEIEITLVNRLTAPPQKGPARPAKQPKGKPTDAPAENKSDPFGFNGGTEKK